VSATYNNTDAFQMFTEFSVADPDPFDTDPALHFDMDPTVLYGSGSLPFQRGNVPNSTFCTSLIDFPCQYVQQDPTRRHTLLNFPFQLILLWSLE
jgi:hypothetical protein